MIELNYVVWGAGTAANTTQLGTAIIGKAPTGAAGGAFRILEAWSQGRSGTVPLTLIDSGTSGTAATTICALPSVFNGVPQAGTPADYALEAGRFLGIVIGVGTAVGPVSVHVLGVRGK